MFLLALLTLASSVSGVVWEPSYRLTPEWRDEEVKEPVETDRELKHRVLEPSPLPLVAATPAATPTASAKPGSCIVPNYFGSDGRYFALRDATARNTFDLGSFDKCMGNSTLVARWCLISAGGATFGVCVPEDCGSEDLRSDTGAVTSLFLWALIPILYSVAQDPHSMEVSCRDAVQELHGGRIAVIVVLMLCLGGVVVASVVKWEMGVRVDGEEEGEVGKNGEADREEEEVDEEEVMGSLWSGIRRDPKRWSPPRRNRRGGGFSSLPDTGGSTRSGGSRGSGAEWTIGRGWGRSEFTPSRRGELALPLMMREVEDEEETESVEESSRRKAEEEVKAEEKKREGWVRFGRRFGCDRAWSRLMNDEEPQGVWNIGMGIRPVFAAMALTVGVSAVGQTLQWFRRVGVTNGEQLAEVGQDIGVQPLLAGAQFAHGTMIATLSMSESLFDARVADSDGSGAAVLRVLGRLARLVVLSGTVVLFSANIAPLAGRGPFWGVWETVDAACADRGWTSVLLVSNIIPLGAAGQVPCAPGTLLISSEAQLSVLFAIPLLLLRSRVRATAAAVLLILVVLLWLSRALAAASIGPAVAPLLDSGIGPGRPTTSFASAAAITEDWLELPPWGGAAAYLVGLFTAWLIVGAEIRAAKRARPDDDFTLPPTAPAVLPHLFRLLHCIVPPPLTTENEPQSPRVRRGNRSQQTPQPTSTPPPEARSITARRAAREGCPAPQACVAAVLALFILAVLAYGAADSQILPDSERPLNPPAPPYIGNDRIQIPEVTHPSPTRAIVAPEGWSTTAVDAFAVLGAPVWAAATICLVALAMLDRLGPGSPALSAAVFVPLGRLSRAAWAFLPTTQLIIAASVTAYPRFSPASLLTRTAASLVLSYLLALGYHLIVETVAHGLLSEALDMFAACLRRRQPPLNEGVQIQ